MLFVLSGHDVPCHAIPRCCASFASLQADLVPGVLAVLPPGLTSLDLATPCTGPVLGIIGERFARLQHLEMCACDGGAIDWAARGTAAALPPLQRLELTYSTPDFALEGGFLDKQYAVGTMPGEVAALLQGASRLQTLSLELSFSPAVGQLWAALPALRHLRCDCLSRPTPNNCVTILYILYILSTSDSVLTPTHF